MCAWCSGYLSPSSPPVPCPGCAGIVQEAAASGAAVAGKHLGQPKASTRNSAKENAYRRVRVRVSERVIVTEGEREKERETRYVEMID